MLRLNDPGTPQFFGGIFCQGKDVLLLDCLLGTDADAVNRNIAVGGDQSGY